MGLINTFFLVFLGAVSPLPALPVLLAAYQNHSYSAVIVVYFSVLSASIVHYGLGLWARKSKSLRSLIPSGFLARIDAKASFLSNFSVRNHALLMLSGVVPTKIYNVSCGYAKVDVRSFVCAGFVLFVCHQPFYLIGGGLSACVRMFMVRRGFSELLAWPVSVAFGILFGYLVFRVLKIFAFIVKKALKRASILTGVW